MNGIPEMEWVNQFKASCCAQCSNLRAMEFVLVTYLGASMNEVKKKQLLGIFFLSKSEINSISKSTGNHDFPREDQRRRVKK